MQQFFDINGQEIKAGQEVVLIKKGIGRGDFSVVDYLGELQLLDEMDCATPIEQVISRDDISITVKEAING